MYSINHHTRLKEKTKSSFGTKKSVIKKKAKVSEKDLTYLNWLQAQTNYGCMVCNSGKIQWHHVKEHSTDKKDHSRLIPLCIEHHTGNELSPHGTPKLWREIYSMEVQHEEAKAIHLQYLKSIL